MFEGMDMNQLLAKAKELQEQFQEKQNQAKAKTVEASVGGGMVKLSMNGALEVTSLTIDKEVIDPQDPETLEDLIRVAVNDAIRQAKEISQGSLSDMLGGLNLPDLSKMFQK